MNALALHPNDPRADAVSRLPSNIDAEQALLGALLYDNSAFERVGDYLKPEHFAEPFHQRLYSAVADSIRVGRLAELILIADRFDGDAAYEEFGGVAYLADLVDRAPPAANANGYGLAILECATRRSLLKLADETALKALDASYGSGDAILAELEAGAAEIAHSVEIGDNWQSPADMIGRGLDKAFQSKGIIEFPSGIPDLDRLHCGLHRGEVTILAARPGMGKTVGGQLFAKETARSGRAVLFFSLEMGDEPMGLRLACDLAYDRGGFSLSAADGAMTLDRIAKNDLAEHQWRRLHETRDIVASWPLRYDTRPGLTMARIESAARRKFREFERAGIEPGLIVIDHMGKVRPTRDRRGDKRLETADVSNDATEVAKRLNVPVLLLCQLSRDVDKRQDKVPILSDLREAGQIEEDARQVIFLYRPEYYLREPVADETYADKIEREAKLDEARNKLFWIIEKNSHGPRGQALTFCDIAASAVREWRR